MVIQGKTTPLFIYHQSVSECEGGGGTSSTQDIAAQLLIPNYYSDFKLDTKSRRSKTPGSQILKHHTLDQEYMNNCVRKASNHSKYEV